MAEHLCLNARVRGRARSARLGKSAVDNPSNARPPWMLQFEQADPRRDRSHARARLKNTDCEMPVRTTSAAR
eukprot:4413580-Alexandrium_andersonii.AAC.1